jgi:hypothetical protein
MYFSFILLKSFILINCDQYFEKINLLSLLNALKLGNISKFIGNRLKGIVSRDNVSTETIGVNFGPKQFAAY